MPIVGMTDRGEAFPQIGNVRKGSPKRTNKQGKKIWGKDLRYFRVEFDESEKEAAALFENRYGNEPSEIVVVMPFDEIVRFWDAWREAYISGAMWHRCNGKEINYEVDRNTGEVVIRNWLDKSGKRVACGIRDLENSDDRCKHTGRLRVIIPELKRLAYLMVHTGSQWDIINISENLAAIHSLNGNSITGIPLVMKRKPYDISTPSGENGKRVRREKWLITIEADPKWVGAKLDAMQYAALPEPRVLQIEEQRAGDVYEGQGPDLEEFEEYDETSDDLTNIDWPQNAKAFTSFCTDMTVTAADVKTALGGMTAKIWLAMNENDYEACARLIYEWLSEKVTEELPS